MSSTTYLIQMEKSLPVTVRAKRGHAIMVCKKCLKRSPEGKVIKQTLKAHLRGVAIASDQKKARVVYTSCVGICPKRAVVLTNGSHLVRGEYLLIDAHSVERASALLIAPHQLKP